MNSQSSTQWLLCTCTEKYYSFAQKVQMSNWPIFHRKLRLLRFCLNLLTYNFVVTSDQGNQRIPREIHFCRGNQGKIGELNEVWKKSGNLILFFNSFKSKTVFFVISN